LQWWLGVILALLAAVAIAGIVHGWRMPRAKGAMLDVGLRFARWLVAALLAASGIWIAISPRADQPVLDAVERAFPAIRSAYMEPHADHEAAIGRQAIAQAREKNRYWIGGVMVLLALNFVVSLPSSRTRPRNSGG
jgi:hypothetical protein